LVGFEGHVPELRLHCVAGHDAARDVGDLGQIVRSASREVREDDVLCGAPPMSTAILFSSSARVIK